MPPNSLRHDEMSSIGKTKNITKLEVGQVILVKQTKCQFPSLTGLGIRAARRNIYLMACWHCFQTPPPSSGWGLTSPSRCQTQRHIQEHGWLTAGTGRGRAGGGWSSDPLLVLHPEMETVDWRRGLHAERCLGYTLCTAVRVSEVWRPPQKCSE